MNINSRMIVGLLEKRSQIQYKFFRNHSNLTPHTQTATGNVFVAIAKLESESHLESTDAGPLTIMQNSHNWHPVLLDGNN